MDWLRIGAFALLILYHVGMVFVPWNFHIKAVRIVEWATLPMLATNAWRLTLLFVVSGYASRALLARSPGVLGFVGNRSYRLLVPLVFGMAVIVVPQPWVELTVKWGLREDFLRFWANDYFDFKTVRGVSLPTWNHLWFVAYLWVYTVLLAVGVAIVPAGRTQAAFDRVFGGVGVLLIPLLWMVAVHAWWFPMAAETHALVGDWVAHAMYVPAFLFGFGLAGSERAMAAIRRWWIVAAVVGLIGFVGVIAVELRWPGNIPAPRWVYRPYGAAHALQQWGTIVALIGVAERWWNVDKPIRSVLTEAVFPFYLIHQTVIVVVAYWLRPLLLPGWAEFALLVTATAAGCAGFYLVGREVGLVRPLIGLRRRVREAAE
jgi:glucan biosynthesis protein C